MKTTDDQVIRTIDADISLQPSEKKFVFFLENNAMATAIIEPDSTISFVNDACCQLSGYAKEEMTGTSWARHITHNDLERIKEYNRQRQLDPGAAPTQYEFSFTHKSGETRFATASLVYEPNSGKTYALFVDTTEIKKAEQTTKDTIVKWQSTFDAMNDGICLLNSEYRIQSCNEAMKQMFQKTGDGIAGKTCWEIVHGTTEPIPECPVIRMKKTLQRESLELKSANQWIEVTVDPFFDSENNLAGMVHIIRDINDKKLADEAVRVSEKHLRELNATKDKFFSIIAHDLNSPFNSILGFSEILIDELQEKNYEAVEEYAGIIRNSSLNATELLKDLIEWASSQAGKIRYKPAIFEISVLLNEITALMNEAAQMKSISLFSECETSKTVYADRNMIASVLRNLISNAIKFTYPGGIVRITAEQKAGEWSVSVQDNGIGMKKENIEKLFRIDQNYSTFGTQNEKGTGLGLILCKEFVEKHGGTIRVESQPYNGTTFCFTIPEKNN